MVADFRKEYGLSVYEAGKNYSFEEAFGLLVALLSNTATLTGSAKRGLPPLSTEAALLIAVQNSVIETIPVKKSELSKKQKMKIAAPKPKIEKKKMSREEAEKRFEIFGKGRKG